MSELGDYLSGKKSRVFYSLGLTRAEIYGENDSGDPEDLTKLFKLLHAHFTAPRRDSKTESSAIESIQTWYKANAENPEYRFSKEIQDALVGFDPRMAQPGNEGIPGLSADKATEIRARFFSNPAALTFVVCGDYLESHFEELVKIWIASIPTQKVPVKKTEDRGIRTVQGPYEKIIRAGKDPAAKTAFIMVTEGPWLSIHEQYASILGEILGIRLREVLREDHGGTYGVSVSLECYKEPFPRTFSFVSFASDITNRISLTEEAKKEISRIAGGEFDERVFESALAIHREKLANLIKSNEYWPELITKALLNKVPLSELISLREQAKTITREEISSWASLVLQPEKALTIVLEPANP